MIVKGYYRIITPTVSPMLGVYYIDQILGFHLIHKSSYGLPNTCNQKGYKPVFADWVTNYE